MGDPRIDRVEVQLLQVCRIRDGAPGRRAVVPVGVRVGQQQGLPGLLTLRLAPDGVVPVGVARAGVE